MPTGQIIAFAFVTLFSGYFIYRVVALKNVEKNLKQVTAAAESYSGRVDEAISRTVENTAAVRENTELLREQTALLRKLLEKQNQASS